MKLRIGKTLSAGARILKENPVIFIPGAAISTLTLIINHYAIDYYQLQEASTELSELISLQLNYQGFIRVVSFILIAFFSLVAIRLAYNTTRGEYSLSLSAKIAAKRFIPVMVAVILWFLSIFIGVILYFIPWIFFDFRPSPLWFIFLIIFPGIFFAVKLYFWHYIVLIEDEKFFSSMSKSWSIVKGNWWRLSGLMVTLILIYIVSFIISAFLPEFFPENITNFLIMTFYYPLSSATYVSAYKTIKAKPEEDNQY